MNNRRKDLQPLRTRTTFVPIMVAAYSADMLRDLLRRTMQANKWSDYRVAQLTGLPQSTIMRFMQGSEPKDATRAKIAKVCTVEQPAAQ